MLRSTILAVAVFGAPGLVAQESVPATNTPVPAVLPTPSPVGRSLPAGTIVQVTPTQEITSKRVEEGQKFAFLVAADVVEQGVVVIPRGSMVEGTITWKTGRAIGGKSGKFEVTFTSITVGGRQYKMAGQHRQEGRGNTVGALLGSLWISGRSAVMLPGQIVNALTVEAIPY
jgi:hypothetical protein